MFPFIHYYNGFRRLSLEPFNLSIKEKNLTSLTGIFLRVKEFLFPTVLFFPLGEYRCMHLSFHSSCNSTPAQKSQNIVYGVH